MFRKVNEHIIMYATFSLSVKIIYFSKCNLLRYDSGFYVYIYLLMVGV